MSEGRVSIPHVRALDGLRGAAVVGVLLYHGDHLKGGYLGVDLFFVLSGYLITSLLLAEWRSRGRIVLSAFWARRARRLLPAVVLVLLGVALYSVLFAAPTELSRIRGDAFATVGYFANWRSIFAGQSYFDLFSAPSPLQHTWSLAIEEQFYVFWPLIFVGLAAWWKERTPEAVLVTAAVLGGASALLMIGLYDPIDPNRVYFGSDTRAFALFAGIAIAAGVAVWGHTKVTALRVVLEAAAVAGVLVLAVMWLTIDGKEPRLYRGGFALAGVAAALLIAAVIHPRRGPIGWLLSFPPLGWLGLISYGLYLWHWPVDIVLNADRTGMSGWPLFVVRSMVALAIAVLSFRLVEQPIRRGAFRPAHWRIAVPVIAAVLFATIVVTTVAETPPAASSEVLPPSGFYASRGQFAANRRLLDTRLGTKVPRVLVLGDSIALTLVESAPTRRGSPLAVQAAAILGCGIVRGLLVGVSNSPHERACGKAPALWREAAAVADPAVVVVMPGAWDLFDRTVDGRKVRFGTLEYERLLDDRLSAALALAHEHHAALVLLSLPCLAPAAYLPPLIRLIFGDARRVTVLNRLLARFAATDAEPLASLDLHRHVCPGGRFESSFRGADGVHFSAEGGAKVWRWIAPQLKAALAPS